MVEGTHEKHIGIHGTGTEITEVVTYISSAWEGGGWHEKARNFISQEDACESSAEFFQPK
jgi:hypothetical protein